MKEIERSVLINALECYEANAEKRGDDVVGMRLTREDILEITHDMNMADIYRWHDLIKNPEDLPKREGKYLIAYRFYNEYAYTMETFTLRYNFHTPEDYPAVAWKEIEPFEEVSE